MNEITMGASLSVSKGGVSVAQSSVGQIGWSGIDISDVTQTIGFSAYEEIDSLTLLGEQASLGAILIKNLDSTNYVELALHANGTNKFAKIKAGGVLLMESGINPESDQVIWAKANTGAVQIEVTATTA